MNLVIARSLALAGRLRPTDLDLAAGSFTALVGPNGSGKTSLLRALARIGRPPGDVVIDGHPVDKAAHEGRARLLSYLPASRDVTWPITVWDMIALSGATREQIDRIVDRLELASLAERRVDLLSTGERARILIARAMAREPRLLLLDEPTANLDLLWQMRMLGALEAERRGGDRALLVAMHDLDVAARYADRLIVMHEGGIIADGSPSEILSSEAIPRAFGIMRSPTGWQPVVRASEDRRSSP